MKRMLDQPLFETEKAVWTWNHALLLGAHRRLWDRVARQLGKADQYRQATPGPAGQVKQLVRVFRRAERLISGDECRTWLQKNRMTFDELGEAALSKWLWEQDPILPKSIPAAAPEFARAYSFSVVTGMLDEVVQELYLQLGSYEEDPPEVELKLPVCPSVELLPAGSWQDTWKRLAPVVAASAHRDAQPVAEERLQTRLAMRGQDYTFIEATQFSFATASQALEARFCVVEDGMDVSAVTEACGVKPRHHRGMALSFPRRLAQGGQQPAVVIDLDLWMVHARREPSLDDPKIRAQIETEVRTLAAEGASRRQVKWC